MNKIADMFRLSPFEPLRHHMAKVAECVSHVVPMFELVRNGDYPGLAAVAKTIFKVEHEADLIKDEIRQSIPKRFYLPVYRGDLLGYLSLQDSVADSVEDIAFLLTIKELKLPPELAGRLIEYVEKIVWVATKAQDVSNQLPRLVDHGFSSEAIERVLQMVATTEKAEWEADRKQYELSKALFAMEDELRATDLFLWFRIFGVLGELADHAEKSADRVRRMLAK